MTQKSHDLPPVTVLPKSESTQNHSQPVKTSQVKPSEQAKELAARLVHQPGTQAFLSAQSSVKQTMGNSDNHRSTTRESSVHTSQRSSGSAMPGNIDQLLGNLRGTALESTAGRYDREAAGALDRERRAAHIRSDFDDLDISEVEYRRVQLEKVFLVGVYQQKREPAENSLKELAALADTAGAKVVGVALQRRLTPDPATFIGKGKAKELHQEILATGADTLIVNAPLQPSQRRGLEDLVKIKVIDRTAVILDIFAQHAQSREGKAQVELAQLEYLLPRLRGWGESMSRQAGGRVAGGAGIGSRGPGETKIELDRRRIGQRMAKLRKEIAQMSRSRETKRKQRKRNKIASVAIVGYTNAGKSSLLNQLTNAEVMVQNALFATLDPTVRKTQTSDGRVYTLSDTVGFVSDLPHELVEAFRSTLEEVAQADVLVHVVDAAHSDPLGQIASVKEILAQVEGLGKVPQIIALNKIDLADPVKIASIKAQLEQVVGVSAWTGQGIAELRLAIEQALPRPQVAIDYVIPYSASALVAQLHDQGTVEKVEYLPQGTHLVGRADGALARALRQASLENMADE